MTLANTFFERYIGVIFLVPSFLKSTFEEISQLQPVYTVATHPRARSINPSPLREHAVNITSW